MKYVKISVILVIILALSVSVMTLFGDNEKGKYRENYKYLEHYDSDKYDSFIEVWFEDPNGDKVVYNIHNAYESELKIGRSYNFYEVDKKMFRPKREISYLRVVKR